MSCLLALNTAFSSARPILVDAIAETFGRGEQALLFLNRRGYAPVTLCRRCGFKFECPNCSAWLVEHRFRRRLECHHCGKFIPIPEDFITNNAFGGPDMMTLYVTAGKTLFKLRTDIAGLPR